MFRAFILALSLTAVAFTAGSPKKIFPFSYTQHDLPNGLRLITVPTGFPNIVALYIVVQTGSRNEVEAGKTGFAHLFEHLMFRGSEKFPPEKYQEILTNAGAFSNAYTSDDLTAYYTIFSKEDLETILAMEADRFEHLTFDRPAFKTETLAVLGEYNKNSANPLRRLEEALQDAAFRKHPYKHTPMGLLKDVQDMPEQYDYSLKFFDRYYRPEYTTIILAGDVNPDRVRMAGERYWSGWQRGGYKPEIPLEPAQDAPRTNHVHWPTPTLPWIAVAFRGPAYTDTEITSAAQSAVAYLGFSENSDLYQKLVVQEQKVDTLYADVPNQVDPFLFSVMARVKKEADLEYVRGHVLDTIKSFADKPVPKDRLQAVNNNLRYSFSMRLDNSESIAGIVARFVALRRTPESINRLYALYAQLTPADIQRFARTYFVENGRTIVTLTGAAPAGGQK